jgi:hypothetical protein
MPADRHRVSYSDGAPRTVTEFERDVPVVETADVVVAGGGTAGFVAALAVREGVTPRQVPYPLLRATLVAQGMSFEDAPSDVRQDPSKYR